MTSSISKKFERRQRPRVLSAVFCSAVVAATVLFSPLIHYFEAEAFTVSRPSPLFSPSSSRATHRPLRAANNHILLFSSADDNQAAVEVEETVLTTDTDVGDRTPSVVRVPLKFIGPYPCLALKFPNLATESQRSKNQTGISLDFVLDTAANINTIQGQVAQELKLEILKDSPALPGVSSSGPMAGGETYMLGDSELVQVEIVGGDESKDDVDNGRDKEPFEFMQELTAAVIPVVNPGSAGLLGLAFFYCFEGGVEFQWGAAPAMQPQGREPQLVDGLVVEPTIGDVSSPSITFYGQESSELKNSLSILSRVPIDPIPRTQLPSVRIKINGVEMVALLDTGSPITVLNERAAEVAGVQTMKESTAAASDENEIKGGGGWNPFASVVDKFKEAQATAEAASKGEILMIGGIDGKATNLYRSTGSTGPSISLTGSAGEDVSLGSDSKVYVGDIPGLVALNGIGVDSPPAVVLGLDVLRQRPRMVFRPRENELYI
jgi:hypothetical protein